MKIPRIVFNFNDKCLNGCPFCFIPFDGKGAGNPDIWKRVLARINELSPRMLSFSGCDPLFYNDFYDVLKETPKRCVWGMDTSLIFLNKQKLSEISKKLDLFSTSLDDTPTMQRYQRYPTAKLKKFFENLDFVKRLFPQIVVHTLYSDLNKGHLTEIADALIAKNVKTWVLYQFWPFDITKNLPEYMCEERDFISDAEGLANYCKNKIYFEYFPYSGRANGYFFVSSLGDAYTTVEGNPSHYLYLGSIFDEDIAEKWEKFSNPARSEQILNNKLNREGG